jgi:hypothetical protein
VGGTIDQPGRHPAKAGGAGPVGLVNGKPGLTAGDGLVDLGGDLAVRLAVEIRQQPGPVPADGGKKVAGDALGVHAAPPSDGRASACGHSMKLARDRRSDARLEARACAPKPLISPAKAGA